MMVEPKLIKQSRKELSEWLTTPGYKEFHYDNPLRELETLLPKDHLAEKDLTALWLDVLQIGTWRIRTGGLAVLDRKPDGWTELQLGFALKAIEQRLVYFTAMRRMKGDRASGFAGDCALVLIHAMATGDQAMADELADMMTQATAHGVYGTYNECGFVLFVINLFQVARGDARRNIGFDEAEFGDRYRGVWTHWDSVDDLSKECVKLCETHLELATVDDEAWIGQFGIPPCEVYPVEILALQRVRKKLGLPVPTCDHDLMKSPLTEAPVEPPKLTDDLATRVRERLRKVYDGF
jgi:hypothetical protein